MQVKVAQIEKIETMLPSMLVSATYDGVSKSAVLKFYEPTTQKLFLWKDEIGHKPYCYSKLSPDELDFLQEREDVLEIKTVKKYDLIKDKEIEVSKITVDNPLSIGGNYGDSIKNQIETWESDIKYYETYLYDRKLIVGKYYEITDGLLKPHNMEISDEVKLALKSLLWDKVDSKSMIDAEEFKEFISEWADLLNQPIPKIKRLSVDIEVEFDPGRFPDPKLAEKRITAIGLKGTDDFDQIFVLKTEGTEKGHNELNENIKVTFYDLDKEKEMIADAFKIIEEFPFVLTYNGDEFDLPYLYNRAERLGISNKDNPLYMMRDSATLKHGVHIDLYRTLSNRSFQIYAFSQSYTDFSLNSVSKALLGKEKIDYGLELGLMVEKSKYIDKVKFVCVRYGNVLNSRGSIIPTLHKMGRNNEIKNFYLTDQRMTRFVMTLEQSVQLIEHAILYGESGDIVIPKLVSCHIKDLLEIFSEKYNKPIVEKNIRAGEKMMESLINKTQSMRLVTDEQDYTFIKPSYKNVYHNGELIDYNSTINPLTKEELQSYLLKLELL